MMAVDSLHAAVHLIVPSGVSFCCSSPCRRACSAGAFAPHFALPSAPAFRLPITLLTRHNSDQFYIPVGPPSKKKKKKTKKQPNPQTK
ncbi:hypothetical protein KZ848_12665, partial [Pseudomonas aeruginosa]|nr:hypothetical protein [Pseudomonas aeruginosa]